MRIKPPKAHSFLALAALSSAVFSFRAFSIDPAACKPSLDRLALIHRVLTEEPAKRQLTDDDILINNEAAKIAVELLVASGVEAEYEQKGRLGHALIKPVRGVSPLNSVAALVQSKLTQRDGSTIYAPFRVARKKNDEGRPTAEALRLPGETLLLLPHATIDLRGKLESVTLHELVHILQDAKEAAGDINAFHGELVPKANTLLGEQTKGALAQGVYSKKGFRLDEILTRARELQFLRGRLKLDVLKLAQIPVTAGPDSAEGRFRQALTALIEARVAELGTKAREIQELSTWVETATAPNEVPPLEKSRFEVNGKWIARVSCVTPYGELTLTVPLAGRDADSAAAFRQKVKSLRELANAYREATTSLSDATTSEQPWGGKLQPAYDAIDRLGPLSGRR